MVVSTQFYAKDKYPWVPNYTSPYVLTHFLRWYGELMWWKWYLVPRCFVIMANNYININNLINQVILVQPWVLYITFETFPRLHCTQAWDWARMGLGYNWALLWRVLYWPRVVFDTWMKPALTLLRWTIDAWEQFFMPCRLGRILPFRSIGKISN